MLPFYLKKKKGFAGEMHLKLLRPFCASKKLTSWIKVWNNKSWYKNFSAGFLTACSLLAVIYVGDEELFTFWETFRLDLVIKPKVKQECAWLTWWHGGWHGDWWMGLCCKARKTTQPKKNVPHWSLLYWMVRLFAAKPFESPRQKKSLHRPLTTQNPASYPFYYSKEVHQTNGFWFQ